MVSSSTKPLFEPILTRFHGRVTKDHYTTKDKIWNMSNIGMFKIVLINNLHVSK